MTAAILEYLAIFACEFLVLHLFFHWIERRLPERPEVDLSHLSAEERLRIAKKANRFGTLTAMLLTPVLVVVWALGFYGLQRAMIPDIPDTLFVTWPTGAMHIMPGIFAGIALGGPLGLLLMKLRYGRRFHEVMATGDAQFQFDVRKWMYATFVWIVPTCVDIETFWLGRFVIFTRDGIHSRGMFERRAVFHPYSQISAIYASDGKRLVNKEWLPDRRYEIHFRDGKTVPAPRFAYHDGRPEDLESAKWAEKRSGVPIRWVQELP